MMRYILFVFILLIGSKSFAQLDSVQTLKVVNLSTVKLQKLSKGYKVLVLSDSVILKNTESFTSLLRFNTPIYIKEYGAGGTSTASFRGTSASNTAVIWNGININSINNGQTGFNALTVNLFDNINVRSGGGSIEFGSGAIGGTIHLNDQLSFGKHFDNQVVTSLGSYNTYNSLYKVSYGNESIAAKFGVSFNQSENDYDWLGTDGLKNENGAYENLSFNLGFAYKLNNFSKFSVFSSKFNGDREFSGTLPNPSAAKEKYKDYNFRNLIAYNFHKNEFTHAIKFAYLTQEYRYFVDKNVNAYNYGKSKTYLLKYNFNYQISQHSSIESVTELESVFGSTDEIREQNRKQFSQFFIYNLSFENIVSINAKIRKDFNSDYKIPLIFALGAEINLLKNTIARVNGSKNYRVPTYNDLYWPALGNLDLIPESSLQGDFGVTYKSNTVKFDIGAFYIKSSDKIVWTPGGDPDRPGIWTPINVAEALNKGVEFTAAINKAIHKHLFNFNLNYSYTIAKDKSTNNYLTYVPKHLANGSLGYSYKRFSAFYQHLFTGEVYTTTDNLDTYTVPYYNVGNAGVNYNIIKSNNKQLGLGVKVNNVFNKEYEVLPSRPMPNRNFNININFKF
ncbi:TonB-dependent receptor plug domain-containing protein [Lutibacter holmesii]|uniref:TonB-dependent receptor plug domain-containing protein n=1 Tax=Lutibacter holmesii TaxID=1137985 RepID=A0ABW3WPS3_9FLAO